MFIKTNFLREENFIQSKIRINKTESCFWRDHGMTMSFFWHERRLNADLRARARVATSYFKSLVTTQTLTLARFTSNDMDQDRILRSSLLFSIATRRKNLNLLCLLKVSSRSSPSLQLLYRYLKYFIYSQFPLRYQKNVKIENIPSGNLFESSKHNLLCQGLFSSAVSSIRLSAIAANVQTTDRT